MHALDVIMGKPGRLEAEVESHNDELRAFVTVTSARKGDLLGGEEQFAYLPEADIIYRLVRYRIEKELIEREIDITEDEICDIQSIVVPDIDRVVSILEMWLPSLELLKEPRSTDAPY